MRPGLARGLVPLAMAALALGPGLASAQGAAPPASAAAELRLGPAGGDAELRFPFELVRDGEVYAKLLPAPWSPVLPSGVANGTVRADRAGGLGGWWVRFVVEPAGGEPLGLGHYADAGASPALALSAGQHAFALTVHAPAGAGPVGAVFRVDVALAHREPGSALDASRSFAALLTVVHAEAPPPPGEVLLLLAVAAGVAGGAALLAARRARGPKEWL